MNKVILTGHLSKDVESRSTNTGKMVASFTLAVNQGFGKDAKADFIPCVAWEKWGENAAKYLAKGSHVLVEGRLQTRSYDAKDGTRRFVTEVVVQYMEFLSQKPQNAQCGEKTNKVTDNTPNLFGGTVVANVDDDSIPF
jgi:single-strand DNA-binding protein